MNNLYKNNNQDILLSDTSITNTDSNKYTMSILNSLLDNNIQYGGAFPSLSFLKPKSQPVQQVPPKVIYKQVTDKTAITPSERKQFEEFMLTNPMVKIDNIIQILKESISRLNEIKPIVNINQ